MDLTLGKFIVWLIVGGLAGTFAARFMTFKKEGLGGKHRGGFRRTHARRSERN